MVYKNSNNTQSALVKLVVEEMYKLDSCCYLRSTYIVLGNSNIYIFKPNKIWYKL